MKLTYKGSCHCGNIRYEADVDLDAGTGKCNCSICWKRRYWGAIVKPDGFRLQCDEANIADYQFGSNSVHHRFCKTCGIQVFSKGYLEMEPFNGWFYALNLATLDDASDVELAMVPIEYENGIEDDYDRAPPVTAYL